MKTTRRIILGLALIPFLALPALAGTAQELMQGYKAARAADFNAARGETMWNTAHAGNEGPMSCATCHTADLKRQGAHNVTGETIKPLAPSANPARLTDPRFVEKWFKRNCKEVLARECTPREKGDFLAYIISK